MDTDTADSAPAGAQREFVDWDVPGRIDELTRRWNAGERSGDIAKAMGISRNALIAKAHRIGLAGRPAPIKYASGDFRLPKVKTVTAARAVQTVAAKQSASLAQTAKKNGTARPLGIKPGFDGRPLGSGTCQYPFGHVGDPDFHFCTARAIRGKPYCHEHDDLCLIKPGTSKHKQLMRAQRLGRG